MAEQALWALTATKAVDLLRQGKVNRALVVACDWAAHAGSSTLALPMRMSVHR